jgi:hypothetical protein
VPSRASPYSFSYPHLLTSPTVQQPVSIQASYRLWQTRCVPQCNRSLRTGCTLLGRGFAVGNRDKRDAASIVRMAKCNIAIPPRNGAGSYDHFPKRTTENSIVYGLGSRFASSARWPMTFSIGWKAGEIRTVRSAQNVCCFRNTISSSQGRRYTRRF